VVTTSQPIRVKFLGRGRSDADPASLLRQFPGSNGRWAGCEFLFDPDETRYDWLVVYDDLPTDGDSRFSMRAETLRCPREHTLLVTMEPVTVKRYGSPFTDQFGHVLTSQTEGELAHASAIRSQPALRWYYGLDRRKRVRSSFDEMVAAQPPSKSGLLATVCSSKRQRHTLHDQRYRFTLALKAAVPELEWFGHGVRPMDDKAEAIDPFRFHVAIENHVAPHHWTEKLSDPFLGFAVPIYFGAPNAADYFPEDSFVAIDIRNPEEAIETILKEATAANYQRRLSAVMEARHRVLCHYNLFAVLANLIEQRHYAGKRPDGGQILSRRRAKRAHPIRYLAESIAYVWSK